MLFIFDLLIISVLWLAAYWLRFNTDWIPLYNGVPPIKPYLLLILPILIVWVFIFKAFNLYRPRRITSHLGEILDIAKACSTAVVVLIAITFFVKKFEFSRVVFIYFWVLSILVLSMSRALFRESLRFFRRLGYNQRHIIIVGDGVLARNLIMKLKGHPELGLNVVGLLSSRPERVGKRVQGKEIFGIYNEITSILQEQAIDQIFVAVPFSEMGELEGIRQSIGKEPVTIKVVPDYFSFFPFCGGVEVFEGLPILNIQDSPLYGWDIVLKRVSDILISGVAIIVTLPLMLLIAVMVKLTSPGPIFYRQERAGLDGKVFDMLKFRTMGVDAEKETGPVWAKENDPRRTKFGTFLRKTSLDELPQFFNVIKGDMSVVGPRPERPEFIHDFQENIPRYLLRHKMKAGITGWAQVNGWRGNTSLKKRIKYDLYYIEHWNLTFDLKILWLTIWKGFIHKHAY